MKDKNLVPKKVGLNQTYSIEEIDIDIKRPNIDDSLTPVTPLSKSKVLVESSKVTITKTISTKSTEIKTVKTTKNFDIPDIVITPCEAETEAGLLIDKTTRIEKTCNKILANESDTSFEVNRHVSSKIVEEKTIDQLQDIDLFDQSTVGATPRSICRNKQAENNIHIEALSFGSDIKCKCCKSTSTYCSKGSYIIVKNTQPANVQFESFDNNKMNESGENVYERTEKAFESTNYYLVNNKLDDLTQENNNNDINFPNKNLEISQNVFENDEYHLSNLKKLKPIVENQQNNEKDAKNLNDTNKNQIQPNPVSQANQQDPFTSLNLSTYLTTGHLCCSKASNTSSVETSTSDKKYDTVPEVELTVIPEASKINHEQIETTSHIGSDNELLKNLVDKHEENDYLYLYVSGNKCNEIFTNGKISLDKVFHNGKIIEAILLLTLPPNSSDNELLFELFGPNVPVEKNRVQCYIKLNRAIFDKNKKYLIKISESKYLCTKRIEFGAKFPKHEFRFRFNKD